MVGDDNHRMPAIAQLMQDRHHLFARMAVQCAGWFIGKNYLTAVHQCPRDADALLLTTRKLCRIILCTVFQPQPLQQLLGTKQSLFPLKTSIDGGYFNVLLGG